MGNDRVRESVERLQRWLANHAPRTHAGLLPPLGREELAKAEAALGRALPEGFQALYLAFGGQSAAAAPGIFRGYYVMPMEGVDGFLSAHDEMAQAAAAGAAWASRDMFPFAKDFSGNMLCVERKTGRVVEILDGEVDARAPSMESFVATIAVELDDGEIRIVDEAEYDIETFEVVFDATRPRAVGDRVTHSVFEAQGIEGTVESLDVLLASPFEKRKGPLHGFAARLVARDPDRVSVEVGKLVDAMGRPIRVDHGKQSGGGKPGVAVYVASERPLPQGSRLHIEVQRRTLR